MLKLIFYGLVWITLVLSSAGLAESKVIIIGGWGKEMRDVSALQKNIPDSEVFLIGTPIDPVGVAAELKQYLKARGISKISLIGFSYGGIVARQFAASYPESVKELVLIAAPIGGMKMPGWLSDSIFGIKGAESQAPLYLIIGTKGDNKWYLDADNDGVVGIESALAITTKRPIDGARVFPYSHDELIKAKVVAEQIIDWLHLKDGTVIATGPTDARQ